VTPGHTHDERQRHHSPDEPITAHPGAHQQINRFTESSRLVPWLMLVCILAGIALAMSITTLVIYTQDYRELEREFRLTQNDYDDVKVALELHGINPHPHFKGQSK
jgi:hypothetical protein